MLNKKIVIHISDLHFSDPTVHFHDLKEKQTIFTKRYIGWLNHRLRRGQHFTEETRHRVIQTLLKMDWDYLVISGDLATLSLEQEFVHARKELAPLLKKGKVIITHGNHDRYVKEAVSTDLLATYFHDCFPFSNGQSGPGDIKFLEIGSQAVLVEIDTAIPRSLISSRGKVNVRLEEYENLLSKQFADKLKIAVSHYPAYLPPGQSEGYFHSLADKKQLRRFLINTVDLHLHGHVHKSWHFYPTEDKRLACINSGGCFRYRQGNWAGFHKITINNKDYEIEKINP